MNFPLAYKRVALAASLFTAAATSQTVQVAVLPPGATVWFARLDLVTEFQGGSIATYTISVGDGNSTTQFTNALDVHRARAGNTFAASTITPFSDDLVLTETVNVTATTTGGNVNAATQGSATLHLYYTVAQSRAAQFIDMSKPAANYPGLLYTGASEDVAVAASTSTTRIILAGATVFEDRGNGVKGLWTFPAITNDAPQDISTWTLDENATVVAVPAGAPDGVSTAYRVHDIDAVNVAGYFTSFAGEQRVQMVWVRDAPVTPPTSPGMLASNDAAPGANNGGGPFGSGNDWRRISYIDLTNVVNMAIFPAGASPSTADGTATGAVDVYGPSSVAFQDPLPPYGGTADYFTVLGSGTTSASSAQIDTSVIFPGNGDLNISGLCVTECGGGDSLSGTVGDRYFFGGVSGEGVMNIRYNQGAGSQGTAIAAVRGADFLSLLNVYFADNDDVVPVAWYQPSTGNSGIQFGTNGAFQEIRSVTSGGAIIAPTTAYLGADENNAHQVSAMWQNFGTLPFVLTPEFIALGDSNSTGYFYKHSPFSFLYPADAARKARPGIAMLGIKGSAITDQQAVFDASPYKAQKNIKAVLIQTGINLILANASAATYFAEYNALIVDIRTTNPGAEIIGIEISPCAGDLTAPQLAVWQTVNAGYTNGSIVGLDAVVSAHVVALSGPGFILAPQYSIDGLHFNEPGSQIVGLAIQSVLVARGLLVL